MLYLAVSPREAQDAARYPCRLAYAAYRMGPESGLLRQSLPLNTQGGLLLLSDREAPPLPDPEALADELWTALNEDNKVSLFVRYIDRDDGTHRDAIRNKHQ